MNRTEEEKLFSRDLAIRLYPGKWSTAKGMARERTTKCEGVDYWLLARKFYLELGGEYVEQIDPAYLAKYHGEPGAERELLIYWLLQAYNTLHREGYESGMTDDEQARVIEACRTLADR